ncbi:hypothetical protein L6E12_04055 [Actinokineospora sp. PR83]|uniref:hypothetical protein n=1 Tax=Actinokineospora sp. PR83 TaxID=2884908 RepID=UPI001F1617C9|nr:hypothetical protein [Actinokineospora sp. PR83]MCG8914963.1 hypothetical protein [Actinokineospora sp. PR83]
MTVTDREPWLLRGDRPGWTPAVRAGIEYHRVYATEKRRILRGIVAIALLVAGLVGFAILFQRLSEAADAALFARSGP